MPAIYSLSRNADDEIVMTCWTREGYSEEPVILDKQMFWQLYDTCQIIAREERFKINKEMRALRLHNESRFD